MLPEHAPRVLLTAVTEQVTVSAKLTKPVTLIGSRRDCDLSIGHSDVCKVHCALVNTGTGIIATDLCTRSGTFVNGQPVSLAALRPGDELRVGSEPVGVWFPRPPDEPTPTSADEHEADFELRRPLRLTGTEQSFGIATLPAVIGRRSACAVVLDTPDVSLTHALLFLFEGRLAIFDLGSRSGTYINGQRVGLAWLADGDELSIGGERLSVTFDGSQVAPPSAAAAVVAVDAVDVPLDAAGPPDPACAGLDAGPSSSRAPAAGELAAISRREAELDHREAELDEREAKLAAAERELARRQAEVARRERTNAEAAAQVAASLDELNEACRTFGLARTLAVQPSDPDAPPATPAGPNAGLGWQHAADAPDQAKLR